VQCGAEAVLAGNIAWFSRRLQSEKKERPELSPLTFGTWRDPEAVADLLGRSAKAAPERSCFLIAVIE